MLVERSCQIPECAESFLSDIAVSFNAVDDPVVGCSSLVFVSDFLSFFFFLFLVCEVDPS